jgi:hypothetical protein
MFLHLFIYRRSRVYRRIHLEWVSFCLFRLNGFSRTEAVLSMLAHKIRGATVYHYPKHRREKMCREDVNNG